MTTLISGSRSSGDRPRAASASATDVTTQTFVAEVIDASRQITVIVDFWAPWCEPCRQLTPNLEKVAAEFKGRIKVVKMNIDESPEIAGQLGVKSIPAVFAFKDSRPVDGFMGALPESQIRQFFDRVAGAAEPGVEDALAAAADMMAKGEVAEAAKIFAAVFAEDPRNAAAIGGLTKCYIEHGEFEHAAKTLALVPEDMANDPEITSARAALELAENAAGLSADLTPLLARVKTHPDDHAARVELAIALNASGDREQACEMLIESIRRNANANDAAARKQLLTFFEAWGPRDEMTLTGRRRLSSILFS